MPTLFLVRHGKTQWTEEKRFAGWGNAPLSDTGLSEAISAGKILKDSGCLFDVCFTSSLVRAQETARIILNELGMPTDKLHSKWRLNERHYGALQGELRSDMNQKYGASQITQWRSHYHAQPPDFKENDPRWQEQLERLKEVPHDQHPRSESMAQAALRTQLLWSNEIVPALRSGKNVLVVAHTNSIRSLVGCIENFNDAQSAAFRISTAIPRYYELDNNLKPLKVQDLTSSYKAKIRHWFIRKRLKFLSGV